MKKLITLLSKIERIMATFFMGAMTLLVIMDVFSREVLNKGFPWAAKAAVYFMIWGGFLGAIMISERAAHLRPEVGDKIWHKYPIAFVRIQNLLTIVFCTVFIYASFNYVSESMEFGDKSVVLKTPLWILQLIIPYTFFSMALRNFYFFLYPTEQLLIKKEVH